MSNHTVRVSNGKYTFVIDGVTVRVLRYGEDWHAQQDALNALHSIMCELDAARVVLEAARILVKRGDDSRAVILHVLARALEKHAALVDDREPPSGWVEPPLTDEQKAERLSDMLRMLDTKEQR